MNHATDWDWIAHASVCDFCLGPSGVEVEVYCMECDRPACTFCMVRISAGGHVFYCPECAAEAAPASDAVPSEAST